MRDDLQETVTLFITEKCKFGDINIKDGVDRIAIPFLLDSGPRTFSFRRALGKNTETGTPMFFLCDVDDRKDTILDSLEWKRQADKTMKTVERLRKKVKKLRKIVRELTP